VTGLKHFLPPAASGAERAKLPSKRSKFNEQGKERDA
jgi:hypothetical protein